MTLTLVCSGAAFAQFENGPPFFPDRNNRRLDDDNKIKEMLSKQQVAHDKKEYEELLERGEEALRISDQLEKSFASSNQLTANDKRKLESLEKLITKIRNSLGGDDDKDEENPKFQENKTSTIKEAFGYLQATTGKLMDELKKTSRFSISAVAIQTSNTLIRLARVLRLKS